MTQRHPFSGRPILFATGCGRSGTTAFRTALTAHPGVISTGTENNVAGDLLHACHVNSTLTSRRRSMQLGDAEFDGCFAELILDLIFPHASAADDRVPLIATYLTPTTAERAMSLFPCSRCVGIIRHGVRTLESRLAHASFSQQPFEYHCQEWKGYAELHEWCTDRPEAMFIRHENLVDTPEQTMRRVIEFADLPTHDAPAETLRSNQYHPTPADRRPVWQSWTGEQRETFDNICGPQMQRIGYTAEWNSMQLA